MTELCSDKDKKHILRVLQIMIDTKPESMKCTRKAAYGREYNCTRRLDFDIDDKDIGLIGFQICFYDDKCSSISVLCKPPADIVIYYEEEGVSVDYIGKFYYGKSYGDLGIRSRLVTDFDWLPIEELRKHFECLVKDFRRTSM